MQVLGIDLGKNSCSLVGLDAESRVMVRRRMRRESMEACCGAYHLGRQLAAQGHEVRPMSLEYVRFYVKAQ